MAFREEARLYDNLSEGQSAFWLEVETAGPGTRQCRDWKAESQAAQEVMSSCFLLN